MSEHGFSSPCPQVGVGMNSKEEEGGNERGGFPAQIQKSTGKVEVSLGCAEGQSEPDHCLAGAGGRCGLGVVHADREGGRESSLLA